MSEKLCLQWNDFKDNVLTAFSSLRGETDFADVTLACEDGELMEAHKVILSASSPFFRNILKKNKHSHPLIYMRGVKSEVMLAILDFLYFGETNLFQDDLDLFLAIAEELHLKGLKGSNNDEMVANELPHQTNDMKERMKENPVQNQQASVLKKSYSSSKSNVKEHFDTFTRTVAVPSNLSVDLQDLDAKVTSMMEKTPGKNIHKQPLFRCTVCGKEAKNGDMKKHIEANHLEGVSIPCNLCDHIARSRRRLQTHKSKHHALAV